MFESDIKMTSRFVLFIREFAHTPEMLPETKNEMKRHQNMRTFETFPGFVFVRVAPHEDFQISS